MIGIFKDFFLVLKQYPITLVIVIGVVLLQPLQAWIILDGNRKATICIALVAVLVIPIVFAFLIRLVS